MRYCTSCGTRILDDEHTFTCSNCDIGEYYGEHIGHIDTIDALYGRSRRVHKGLEEPREGEGSDGWGRFV